MGLAYYNEFDPAAAAWLRQLILEGLIAPGDVDERSIDDVLASDLEGYTQHHFFAGIGIWSLALRSAGWPDDRPVWTGSCPCQPFSAAGNGEGFNDPRHKWPAWFRLIGQRRPAVIFGEQVAKAGDWLDLVSSDLEGAAFAFGAVDLPSAGFRGAHERQRFYWVADAHNAERWADGAAWDFADWPQAGRIESDGDAGERGGLVRLEHNEGHGWVEWGSEPRRRSTISGRPLGRLALGEGQQQHWGWDTGGRWGEPADGGSDDGLGHHHHHQGLALRSFYPDERGAIRFQGSATSPAGSLLGCDWLLCHDAKLRPVERGTFPLVNAYPSRVVELRGYGNAIDAEVAAAFVGAYLEARADL